MTDHGISPIRRSRADLIVIVAAIVIALTWVWPRIQLLFSQPAEEGLLHPEALPFSYLNLAIFLVYLAALVGCARKAGVDKYAHLLLLFLMSVFVIIGDVEYVRYYVIPESETNHALLSNPWLWWSLSGGLRWLLWFGWNVWYFVVRPKAKACAN